jgi:hypothetical protein
MVMCFGFVASHRQEIDALCGEVRLGQGLPRRYQNEHIPGGRLRYGHEVDVVGVVKEQQGID